MSIEKLKFMGIESKSSKKETDVVQSKVIVKRDSEMHCKEVIHTNRMNGYNISL